MKYVVVVRPKTCPTRYIQISDAYDWAGIEFVYLEYMRQYEHCDVQILKYVKEDA